MLEVISTKNQTPEIEKTVTHKSEGESSANNSLTASAVKDIEEDDGLPDHLKDTVKEEKVLKIEPTEAYEAPAKFSEPVVKVSEAVENNVVPPEEIIADTENSEVDLEEDKVAATPSTFGEKFSSSRSVNDLLLEHSKSDLKYSHMPVDSLQSAIGINDKFLFTRELFEGDADAFAQTIRIIDAMSGINDAAAYLRDNFKWKKNETSLKFIDLVKRRFL
jgi:hypothetical protein